MRSITIPIAGMSCGHCVRAVEEALGHLRAVKVDRVRIGSATMSYDPAQLGVADIARAIEDAGYQPQLATP
jgi:copper chaperone